MGGVLSEEALSSGQFGNIYCLNDEMISFGMRLNWGFLLLARMSFEFTNDVMDTHFPDKL
jgi:hypothetical protein